VLTWLVLVGALLAKQRVRRAENIVGPLPQKLLEEEWISIKYNGEKIGWARGKYTPIKDGYNIDGEARMAIKALGAKQSVYTTAKADVDNEFHLKTFDFLMESSAQSIRVDGEVDGKVLRYRVRSLPTRSRTPAISRSSNLSRCSTSPRFTPRGRTSRLGRNSRSRPSIRRR